MSTSIEETVIEKLRVLPVEKRQEVLTFIENLVPPTGGSEPTIWEKIRKRAENVPEEVWEKLPRDGAEQHDHYLYGAPKK